MLLLRLVTKIVQICECQSPLAHEILLCEQRQQIIGGYPKTITSGISPEFSEVAKCNAHFIKKPIKKLNTKMSM